MGSVKTGGGVAVQCLLMPLRHGDDNIRLWCAGCCCVDIISMRAHNRAKDTIFYLASCRQAPDVGDISVSIQKGRLCRNMTTCCRHVANICRIVCCQTVRLVDGGSSRGGWDVIILAVAKMMVKIQGDKKQSSWW